MAKFASETTVSVDKSRAEIEKTLRRYGATGFAYGWKPDRASIAFEMANRRVRFVLPLPASTEFSVAPGGRHRGAEARAVAHDKAIRQRWRALGLVIKAKLEAVESKIAVFDEEFMAFIVMPDGSTIGDKLQPQIRHAYATGEMPPLLGFDK